MNSVKVLGIEFKVGETYNHAKFGKYTVFSISGDKMLVRLGEGEESEFKELTVRIAASMIFNEKCKEAKALNKKSVVVNGNENQVAYTIGRIAKNGLLCCTGIKDKLYEAFKFRYEKASGCVIEKLENIALLCDDMNKWGTELTINLPKNFLTDSISGDDSNSDNDIYSLPEGTNFIKNKDGSCTINDNKFWWSLVENFGFVLGNKQDIEIIKDRCPENLKEYLILGYNS